MRHPWVLPGLAEAPEMGDEGWDVLGALEELQERGLAALPEQFGSSQPQSAHRANNHQSK